MNEHIVLNTVNGDIKGTLLVPEDANRAAVALIIAGSGPTDRNGNNPRMTNNSLKMLAEALQQNGIASVRYDKRAVAESQIPGLDVTTLTLDDYIADAQAWIHLLKTHKQFSQITVIGHSEGSLIGMIASRLAQADQFVSLAGMGRSIDSVLIDQLREQSEELAEQAVPILNTLAQGKTVPDVPEALSSLFPLGVQRFWMSLLKYDPIIELGQLNIPSLIIQGTTDIQVTVNDAQLLSNANSHARLTLIDGMNHILKAAPLERTANIASYDEESLPLHPDLMGPIIDFIK